MKILSYNPQGKLLGVEEFDAFVPDYIKSYDKQNSVLPMYKLFVSKNKNSDALNNSLKAMAADILFRIDYDNFLKSSYSQLKDAELKFVKGGDIEDRLFVSRSYDCEYEYHKVAEIIKYYGHRSKQQIDNDRSKGIYIVVDCPSAHSWIFSLANYAYKKIRYSEGSSESKEIMFRKAFLSVINRYYLALRNMAYRIESDEIREQLIVLMPFISKKMFRVEYEDLLIYNTDEFIVKFVNHFCRYYNDRRHDSYCILQLLRGDYKPFFGPTENLLLLNFEISEKKYSDIPVTYTLGNYDGGSNEVIMSDRELVSLLDPNQNAGVFARLFQIINKIKDDYENNLREIWNNHIFARRLLTDSVLPKKIQSWSYLFFDEISCLNQLSKEELIKEQECFHALIYKMVNLQYPQQIDIDRFLLFNFFMLIKRNGCHDQNGFYEKIYTVNQIISHADVEDIKIMSVCESWNQIESYKNRIEAINDLIHFLEPILNSEYVNEAIISIDNFKKLVKNILRNESFLKMTTHNKPKQLLKKIETNKGCKYNCNIALLFNILGVFYRHVVHVSKETTYLLKQRPTIAFSELVSPYDIKGDKNNNKFLTQYDQSESQFSLISPDMEQMIVNEMKRPSYYK